MVEYLSGKKKTGKLINLMKGDRQVVNVISGHPSICVMATSGIDMNVKIWESILDRPVDLQNAQQVADENHQRARRSFHPLAWFIGRLGEDEDSGEEDDGFECEVQ